MRSQLLKPAAFVVVVIGLALMAVVLWAAEHSKSPATPAQLEDAPLTIATSTIGRFARGMSWHLSINSAGQAALTIETYPECTVKQFNISKEQIAELRKALFEQRFFELKGEYGELVPDGSTETLTVVAGEKANTVRIHYLMNWVHYDVAKLREPSRAVRLLVMLRSWFDDAQAVDLRKSDRMVLDAVK